MERVSRATSSTTAEHEGPDDLFTTETAGLSTASRPQVIRLNDGDRFDLRITPVRKRIDDAELRMLGYNGSIPGPTLHVDQGSEITVQVTQRRRRRGDGPLARPSAGEPLRRRPARDAGTDPDRGDVHLQGPVPRRRVLLVPPAHPRGLRAGDGAVRHDHRRAHPTRRTGPPSTASSASRSTTCSSRTATSRRSTAPVRTTRRWGGSAT